MHLQINCTDAKISLGPSECRRWHWHVLIPHQRFHLFLSGNLHNSLVTSLCNDSPTVNYVTAGPEAANVHILTFAASLPKLLDLRI